MRSSVDDVRTSTCPDGGCRARSRRQAESVRRAGASMGAAPIAPCARPRLRFRVRGDRTGPSTPARGQGPPLMSASCHGASSDLSDPRSGCASQARPRTRAQRSRPRPRRASHALRHRHRAGVGTPPTAVEVDEHEERCPGCPLGAVRQGIVPREAPTQECRLVHERCVELHSAERRGRRVEYRVRDLRAPRRREHGRPDPGDLLHEPEIHRNAEISRHLARRSSSSLSRSRSRRLVR